MFTALPVKVPSCRPEEVVCVVVSGVVAWLASGAGSVVVESVLSAPLVVVDAAAGSVVGVTTSSEVR